PKGAVLTHANLAVQQRLVGEAWGFGPDDVLLHALPLHHMHGLAIALLTALGVGATTRIVSAPSARRPASSRAFGESAAPSARTSGGGTSGTFDAPAIWDAMRDATVFMGV